MRAYVGMDWGAREVVVAVGVEQEPVESFGKIRRGLEEVEDLFERIRNTFKVSEITVGIEAGAVGWVRLCHAAGADVRVIDPKQAKRFGESLSSSGAKDDKRDAKMLAKFVRSPDHAAPYWQPPSSLETLVELKLTDREQLQKERVATIQRIRVYLRETLPALDDAIPSSFGKWVKHLLDVVPTACEAAKMTQDNFAAAMAGSGAQTSSLERVWVALKRRRPLPAEDVAQYHAQRLRMQLERLELLDTQIKTLNKELDALTQDSGARQLFQSVKGIGMQLAISILSAGVDIDGTRDALAIKMGAAPVYSGSVKRGGTHMRRAAKSRHKASTYLLGRLAAQHLRWATAMYADGRSRGQSAAHVYRRIARSLLRILQAMIRTDEDHYIHQLKRNRVPWAMTL